MKLKSPIPALQNLSAFLKFRSSREAIFLGLFLGCVLHFAGCATRPARELKDPLSGSAPAGRVSIMAYNVENLFDTTHDAGKEDFTYLPLSEKRRNPEAAAYCQAQARGRYLECRDLNWNEAALQKKIKAVSGSILQVYGRGPDVLILEEVENINVLKRLNQEGLAAAGYQTVVLIEGTDERGIDVGFLSRLPLAGEPKLHAIQFTPSPMSEDRGTRGILQVPVKLPNGATLTVYGVHFPSQGAPAQARIDAINTLKGLLAKHSPNDLWVVGGDWNITGIEDDETGLISKEMASVGLVSHVVGCKDCRGTHVYRGVWDFLDILVFSKSFGAEGSAPWKLLPESIWTPKAAPLQVQSNGRPARFDVASPEGITDHFPIFGEIEPRAISR